MKLGYFLSKRMLFALITLSFLLTQQSYAQQVAKSTKGTSVTNCGGYYEYIPPAYAASKDSFPLIVFIHGIGELGDGVTNLPAVLKNGIPARINDGTLPASFTVNNQTFSFIILSPQFKTSPSPLDILSLINYIKTQYRIDNNRIYITGLSMGGGSTEDFASANDAFAQIPAAVVAVSGNMNPVQFPNAPRVVAKNNVPAWFFHNNGDGTVPSQYSKDWVAMISAYQPAPTPLPKLTIFPVSGHNAWDKAYDPNYRENGMNVYEWMLQYKKGGTTVTPPPPPPPSGNKRVIAKTNIGNGMYYTDAMSAFQLNPGDTLCIPAGDYEFVQLGKLTGTKAKPIVITNCGGLVRLGINTHKSDIAFNFMSGQFIEVSGSGTPGLEYGFDINGKNLDGVQMQGMYFGSGSTDFNVHNMYIHDANILLVAKTTQACDNPQYWEGNYVMRNAKIHHIKGRYSEYEGFYIGNTHYIINFPACGGDVKSHHLENLEVYDNDIQNTGYDGIQVAMADMGDNKVYNNVVRNYGMQKLDAQSYGLLMGGGTAVKVYNNVVDSGYLPGIALFGSGISYVYNNVISNISNGEGINVSDKFIIEPVTAYIYNNTIYNTGPDGIKIYAYLTQLGHKVYNNLVINTGSSGDYPMGGYYIRGAQQIKFDFSNNLFAKTPAEANVIDAAAGNFRLAKGAAAIDAGRDMSDMGLTTDADGFVRPQNGKYDVGAYEYSSNGPHRPPVANAGNDINITLPVNSAQLDGSASTDPDGTIVKWQWKKTGGPAGGSLGSSTTAKTQVTGLLEGTYAFELTVTNNAGVTAVATVSIIVSPVTNNQVPVAVVSADKTVQLPTSYLSADGSTSYDMGGSIDKFGWKQLSGPANAFIATPDAARTLITKLQQGAYTFQLTVTDNKQATGITTFAVDVLESKPVDHTPDSVSLVPNPVSAIARLNVARDGNNFIHVKIYDMSGRLVQQKSYTFSGAFQTDIDVSVIPNGHYIMEVSGTNFKWTKRFIKVRS
ncbi:putative secreted protein (Por secretion system target) [Chitinophaga niastensis]|uniref:Putative secreted protein (Por secretion system target) n=1 Tax=Chitinophaga niastensis TaxID=536980 RepID=A0A2P8HBY1_CHINA|nr:T9SS type A sorting domain-containing protein [Chitinophaga niastensis]PSL43735.1 putative secreted protein (Por secretion system target) [Chitinophaga niastensis]